MQTALITKTEKSLEINGFGEAVKLAEIMATAKLVPTHLQKSPADCLLVIEQAIRWGMSPFAVAQATSIISGKLMFEGKLVAAAIQGSGVINGSLNYSYQGTGDQRQITVSGTLRGESEPRTITAKLIDVKTKNEQWTKAPDQMLSYMGARIWARRHAPSVMLGVYAPDEFDDAPAPARKAKAMQNIQVTPEAAEDGVKVMPTEAPSPAPLADPSITQEQLKEINFLLKQLGYTKEKKTAWGEEVKALYNVNKPTELTKIDAEAVITDLNHELDLVNLDNNPFKETATATVGGAK